MRDSIVVNMRFAEYDMLDGTPNVERHHIFGGERNRELSDMDGLWVPLTKAHHTGKMSVHMNKEMKEMCHIIGQLAWMLAQVANEEEREELKVRFRKRYGETYI